MAAAYSTQAAATPASPFSEKLLPELGSYHGIELLPEMIARAKELFPQISLQQGDFMHKKLPVCDYVLVSGTLNYGLDIFPAIRKLYGSCKTGLGFNLLRKVSAEGILKAHEPKEILSFAKTITHRVVLQDDYSHEDFSLFLYR